LKSGEVIDRVEVVNKADGQGTPVVSGSQVFAAGLASTTAAFVTSKFGVAGTILGAALTTMIITGGAAILNAYLKSLTGNVRKVPQKLRARRERRKAARYAEPPTAETLPGRPDLRDNFMGRLRAAVGWFSHLPLPARRSIVVKGLIAAAVAFVISMGAIYALELGIGNSLSCGLWGNCPEGATPGIHRLGGGGDGPGAGSTIGGGRVSQSSDIDRDGGIIGSDQQQSSPRRQQQDSVEQQDRGYQPPAQQRDRSYQPPTQQQDRGYQPPAQRQQDSVEQQDRGYEPPAQRQTPSEPDVEPVDPNDGEVVPIDPNDGEVAPEEPVDPEVPLEPVQPVPGQPTPQQQAPSE
jgi:hypothetical protein